MFWSFQLHDQQWDVICAACHPGSHPNLKCRSQRSTKNQSCDLFPRKKGINVAGSGLQYEARVSFFMMSISISRASRILILTLAVGNQPLPCSVRRSGGSLHSFYVETFHPWKSSGRFPAVNFPVQGLPYARHTSGSMPLDEVAFHSPHDILLSFTAIHCCLPEPLIHWNIIISIGIVWSWIRKIFTGRNNWWGDRLQHSLVWWLWIQRNGM